MDEDAWLRFTAIFGGDAEAMQGVVRTFLDNNRDLADRAEEALGAGDVGTLRRLSHNLKSTSYQMGGLELSDTSRQLEEAAKSSDMDAARRLFPPWLEQLAAFQAELRQRIQ